ncbi:MAG: hypothetical protein V4615_11665 [Bacteroidota bacterium]
MEILKNTFLLRLFKTDKKLFVVILFFIVGTMYCIVNCNTFLFTRRCEEFPFLLYGMYSLPEETQETYTTYSFVIDGKEVNYAKLKDSQRELITSPLLHAFPLMDSTGANKEKINKLKQWLFRYSVDMRGLETNAMDVYKLTCAYNKNGLPEVLKKELLYTYVLQ